MFLFNNSKDATVISVQVFKYNFCFSSTVNPHPTNQQGLYLNTTFVSLQLIHFSSYLRAPILFKYNFCFSSTFCHFLSPLSSFYLNTTFVSLQRLYVVISCPRKRYLNTTFVSLQQSEVKLMHKLYLNLNTTFVSLQL